ncbi:MAG TPA: C4-type zinc ribbon domain-containing protein [Polyangiaceae bacterium]|nr:C4-type zinc ribbon domain-containing protein [Polyangiaceae bacterium]
MSIQSQIDALEKLSGLDAELKDLSDILRKERGELDTKKGRLAELVERLTGGKRSIEEMERARGDLMGELRQMTIQIDRSREKLSRCRTEREANAVQRELEELRKLHRDREVEIEKLDVLIEQARTDVTSVLGEHDKLEADLDSIEGAATGRIGEAQKSFDERAKLREDLVKAVPPQLYRRYELVRSRRGTALAYTHTGICSACNMHLQPMLFQRLKRGEELSQCPSCNRIIYFRAVMPAGETESSDT